MILKCGKINRYREQVRKVLSEVKWNDFEVRRRTSISKNRGWKVISEVTWKELKWGKDQLNGVKRGEFRRGGMWSLYKISEVVWGVEFGEMYEIE
jgi:hypothetical protein